MRNTGTIYSSTERTPTVLPEMAELLPPLMGEQFAALDWLALALASISGFSRRAILPSSHLSRLRRPFWVSNAHCLASSILSNENTTIW